MAEEAEEQEDIASLMEALWGQPRQNDEGASLRPVTARPVPAAPPPDPGRGVEAVLAGLEQRVQQLAVEVDGVVSRMAEISRRVDEMAERSMADPDAVQSTRARHSRRSSTSGLLGALRAEVADLRAALGRLDPPDPTESR